MPSACAIPARLNAFSSRSLIRRTGEVDFLIRTAEILGAVPQPARPEGLVLLAARNVDQLRRYPLMVLAEIKRRGWAVLPLVSGLLPPAPTGDARIDALDGAISPDLRLSAAAEALFPAAPPAVADLARGRLSWGGIGLDHALWEEAAISRRRYHIDWDCPELQHHLGNLAAWSAAMGRALEHGAALHRAGGPKLAAMMLFNARLPDALLRAWCERQGDPQNLFCLHAANGYQNYFTNFATNVSERYVIRNMTAAPQARAASFPLPENFARHCAARRDALPAIRARFAALPHLARSTLGAAAPPEAQAAAARIEAWRQRGGRVACAFGKVVCDSQVPFDGGPAHASMEDWIRHAIATVSGPGARPAPAPAPAPARFC